MNNIIGTAFFGGIGALIIAAFWIFGGKAEKELKQKRDSEAGRHPNR